MRGETQWKTADYRDGTPDVEGKNKYKLLKSKDEGRESCPERLVYVRSMWRQDKAVGIYRFTKIDVPRRSNDTNIWYNDGLFPRSAKWALKNP